MKYIIGLFLCGLLAVGNGYYCNSEGECEKDECCVAYYAANLIGLGTCVKRARTGAACNPPTARLDFYGGKYLSKCPCLDGDCENSIRDGTPIQINNSYKCVRTDFFGDSKVNSTARVKTGNNKFVNKIKSVTSM